MTRNCPFQPGRDCYREGCQLWVENDCAFVILALVLKEVLHESP